MHLVLSIPPPPSLQVADFNLSRLIQSSSRSSSMAAMNPRWLAPEVLRGEHATQAADVFAFGVVSGTVQCSTMQYSAV